MTTYNEEPSEEYLSVGERKSLKIKGIISEINKHKLKKSFKKTKVKINLKDRLNKVREIRKTIEQIFETENEGLTRREIDKLLSIQYASEFYLGIFGNENERKIKETTIYRSYFDITLKNIMPLKITTYLNKLKKRIKLLRINNMKLQAKLNRQVSGDKF